jgi:hypothetical protein
MSTAGLYYFWSKKFFPSIVLSPVALNFLSSFSEWFANALEFQRQMSIDQLVLKHINESRFYPSMLLPAFLQNSERVT